MEGRWVGPECAACSSDEDDAAASDCHPRCRADGEGVRETVCWSDLQHTHTSGLHSRNQQASKWMKPNVLSVICQLQKSRLQLQFAYKRKVKPSVSRKLADSIIAQNRQHSDYLFSVSLSH